MRLIPGVLTVLAILIADQWSKFAITSHFAYGETLPVTSFFNLVLVYNEGAAFSFLSNASGWQKPFFIAITVLAIAAITWMIVKHKQDKLVCWGLTLIMGGALGNLLDRIRLGHVVDFLDFYAAG